jgi:hypothetical protein
MAYSIKVEIAMVELRSTSCVVLGKKKNTSGVRAKHVPWLLVATHRKTVFQHKRGCRYLKERPYRLCPVRRAIQVRALGTFNCERLFMNEKEAQWVSGG